MLKRLGSVILLVIYISSISAYRIDMPEDEPSLYVYPAELDKAENQILTMLIPFGGNSIETNIEGDETKNIRTRSIRKKSTKIVNKNGHTLDFNVDYFLSLVSAE